MPNPLNRVQLQTMAAPMSPALIGDGFLFAHPLTADSNWSPTKAEAFARDHFGSGPAAAADTGAGRRFLAVSVGKMQQPGTTYA